MIHVLVTHHAAATEPYLDAALTSLNWQTKEHVTWVLCSGEPPHATISKFISDNVHFVTDITLNSPTKKVEYFTRTILKDAPDTDQILIMSNDVVLSENALHDLAAFHQPAIQTCMSNQENGSRYAFPMPYGAPSGYDLSEVDLERVKTFRSMTPAVIKLPWISFYAPFMPLGVYRAVGDLDARFDKKYNDTDYCFRALEKGIPTLVNLAAYAVHYGSKHTKAGYLEPGEEAMIDQAFWRAWPADRIMRFVC